MVSDGVLSLISAGDIHLLFHTKELTVTRVTRPSRGLLNWIGLLSSILPLEAQLTDPLITRFLVQTLEC